MLEHSASSSQEPRCSARLVTLRRELATARDRAATSATRYRAALKVGDLAALASAADAASLDAAYVSALARHLLKR